ncbi:glutamate racemase [Piscinibacter terrae]|uniref:Glutamate racemase n=1 Tax=Piscinibacter terrae TaxID=2496871 RepID=A0A3N7HN95_9BURK|nr:glutamate racemase [Albitalea terrae]RQP23614.1 glutamate racemase [Albitalea terrae]
MRQPCVGVFDSGVGGLSVLRSLRSQLAQAPLLYVADSAHAPYGERSDAYVLDRSMRIMEHLMSQGAIGLVIACNTATAVAVKALRARWPEFPIIGVEPGIKPAVAASRNGRVGVMATPKTIASEKFRSLMKAQSAGAQIIAQPCPGLARLIEEGDLTSAQMRQAVAQHTAPLRQAGVDTVVLGCTHYPFVRHLIEEAMGPDVQIIDTADAVARHAGNTLLGLLPREAQPSAVLQTTGDVQRLEAIASAWLTFPCTVEPTGNAAAASPIGNVSLSPPPLP